MFQRDVVRIISACCPTLLFRDDGKAANGIPDEDKISRPKKKENDYSMLYLNSFLQAASAITI